MKTSLAKALITGLLLVAALSAGAEPNKDLCLNCHADYSKRVSPTSKNWLTHASQGYVSREIMDQTEVSLLGHVSGDPAAQNPIVTTCTSCHDEKSLRISCGNTKWKEHITHGQVSPKVWEYVSKRRTGSTCGRQSAPG